MQATGLREILISSGSIMHKKRNEELIFGACLEEGSFTSLENIDIDQIKGIMNVAQVDLETMMFWKKQAPKESGQWNAILKLSYDVLHAYSEAFLQLDKIKARTHECLFAYLCKRHPELELSWEFLDKIRTMRNRSLYYGKPAEYDDWKSVELPIDLHISVLRKAIEKKIEANK